MMNTENRVSPQAPEIEEAILGACLIEQEAMPLVADTLRPEMFYSMRHQVIYAALLAIAKGNWEQAEEHYRVARDTAQRGGNPSALMLARELEQKREAHQKHLLSEDGAAS